MQLSEMHGRMKRLGVNLRPHGKTAKNIDIVRQSIAGQSGGITVSTLREADYFFKHGIRDILYAVGIAPVKLDHVARLVKAGAAMTVILDSVEQVKAAAARAQAHSIDLPVLIEIDSDGHRSGVTPDDPLLVDIGRLLHSEHGVSLQGVLTHAGGSYQSRTPGDIVQAAEKERSMAVKCAEILRKNGLVCPTVSVGSTPTATFSKDLAGVTEVRAGVFMFQDLVMAGLGVCDVRDIAVSVLASVIGHQKNKGWVITDAGWMALSRDRSTAAQKVDQGYGLVCSIEGEPFNDLIVSSTNQEHGIIENRDKKDLDLDRFPVGSMVRILPNHACATAAMHERYFTVEGTAEIIDAWPRINGW